MSIVLAPQAEADLDAFLGYVHQSTPSAARRMEAELRALLVELERGAFDGPEVELTNGKIARSWSLPPLRIFYQRRKNVLYVLRVYHGRRRPITKARTKMRDAAEREDSPPVFWPPRRG